MKGQPTLGQFPRHCCDTEDTVKTLSDRERYKERGGRVQLFRDRTVVSLT